MHYAAAFPPAYVKFALSWCKLIQGNLALALSLLHLPPALVIL